MPRPKGSKNKKSLVVVDTVENIDEKIIAVPVNDPNYNVYNDISDLPKHRFDEIRHFFMVYKALEDGNKIAATEFSGAEAAMDTIQKAIDSYIHFFQLA